MEMSEKKTVPKKPFFEILPEIQGVLGEENQKVFAKVSMNLGKKWAKTIEAPKTFEELFKKMASYFETEFQLGETVNFEREREDYVLKVRSCNICHGKLVKEKFGITPACSISMFPVGALFAIGAIKEIFKPRSVRLKEIRKPGPPGDCDLIYEIKT